MTRELAHARPPVIRASFDAFPGELIADNFAGGGGASDGIVDGAGRAPDIAINHSPAAIAMHMANHPTTKHFLENIWKVDPVVACGGRPVGLAWFSPDCTHHSRAKGTKPGVVGHEVDRALGTVTSRDHHALTTAFLTKFYGTSHSSSVQLPLPTVTSGGGRSGGHLAEVRAFLVKYYGAKSGQQQELLAPLHTITTKARFGLVTIHGEQYQIVDIGMRMLQPHELFAAQGFRPDYNIQPMFNGKPMTKTAQIELCGNSVCRHVAAAIVSANAGSEQRRAAS